MIYDRTESEHWARDVDDWDEEFTTGDVVLSAGHDGFKTMIVVSSIDLSELDHVRRRGVFWEHDDAVEYAKTLHDGPPLTEAVPRPEDWEQDGHYYVKEDDGEDPDQRIHEEAYHARVSKRNTLAEFCEDIDPYEPEG